METAFYSSPHRNLELLVQIEPKDDNAGYIIFWGHMPQKLYHSCMTFAAETRIGALVKGEEYWIRVDSFNESGITEGRVQKVN